MTTLLINFDTLAAAKRLREAGLDQKTAEAIVTEITGAQAELFTKTDARSLRYELILLMFGVGGVSAIGQVFLKHFGLV